jgi:hypothetical protein
VLDKEIENATEQQARDEQRLAIEKSQAKKQSGWASVNNCDDRLNEQTFHRQEFSISNY